MKKSIKSASARLMAVMMAVVLLVSVIPFSASAAVLGSVATSGALSSNSSVSYAKYSCSTANAYTLEFSPSSGLYPIGYVKNAGSVATISSQVADAQANGYDVHGAINGEFFAMNIGTLTGKLIANGRILSDHETDNEYNMVIDKDGKFSFAQSELAYHFYVEGEEVGSAAIGRINKPYYGDGWKYNPICYFDSACGSVTDTKSSYPGVEVVFNKLNGSELIVEGILEGEVVSVTENTYGTSFTENQFVLYAYPGTTYYSNLASLTAGTKVQIYAEELVADSKETMKTANTVMSATFPVVQNGVNKTSTCQMNSSGDGFPLNAVRPRTAIGVKSNGDYVFFVCSGDDYEGTGMTVSQVADAMIELGCVYAVNLDGGGSSGLYADGEMKFVSENRKVASTIMIVSRNEAVASSSKKAAVNDWIYNANTTNYTDAGQKAAVEAAVAKAEAIYNDANSTNSEYTRAVMDIRYAMGLVADVLPASYISLDASDWAPDATMNVSNDANGALILKNTDGAWPKASQSVAISATMDDYIYYDFTANGATSINFTINGQEFKLNPSIATEIDSGSGDILANGKTYKGSIKVSDLTGITADMKDSNGNLPITEVYIFAIGGAGDPGKVTVRQLEIGAFRLAKGDLNGDTYVNSTDARMVIRSLAGKITLDDLQTAAADYNDDGTTNSADVRAILRVSVGL